MTTYSNECVQCTHFKPHLHYPYVGLCVVKGEVREGTGRVETCSSFRIKTLNEIRDSLTRKGWVYCVPCRRTLTTLEELEEHALRGHTISDDVLIDDVVSEEALSGD